MTLWRKLTIWLLLCWFPLQGLAGNLLYDCHAAAAHDALTAASGPAALAPDRAHGHDHAHHHPHHDNENNSGDRPSSAADNTFNSSDIMLTANACCDDCSACQCCASLALPGASAAPLPPLLAALRDDLVPAGNSFIPALPDHPPR